MDLASLGSALDITFGDTVLYRFSFISDLELDTLDGLMFDHITFSDLVEGIDENSPSTISSKVFPNPADDHITIAFLNSDMNLFKLIVYDVNGAEVYRHVKINAETIVVDTKTFDSGVYTYKLIEQNGVKRSNGRFLIFK